MKTPALLLAFSACFVLVSQGAVLLTYNFQTTGTTNNALSAANTIAPTTNYAVSDFTAGAGLQGNVVDSNPVFTITGFSTTGSVDGNTRHMFVRVGGTDGATQAAAITANDYYSFTISPTAGFALNLSSLAFDLTRGTSTAEVFVRTSLDSFGTSIFADNSSPTGTTISPVTSVALGSSYQNITAPFEVRFYFADNTTSTTTNSIVNSRLDNIVLNGDLVAIPEPGASLLFAFAALPVIGRRRRIVTLR